jgi:hypothetical protein
MKFIELDGVYNKQIRNLKLTQNWTLMSKKGNQFGDTCEDNITMDLKGRRCRYVKWVQLAQDMVK